MDAPRDRPRLRHHLGVLGGRWHAARRYCRPREGPGARRRRPAWFIALVLATGLIPDLDVRVELAAGLPGGGLGTDTTEVGAAIERADDGEGVLVLADLGSGIMSAETALELIDPSLASRVHLSSAPVVEGLIGAYAAAGVGKALDAVVIEAEASVEAKRMQMAR